MLFLYLIFFYFLFFIIIPHSPGETSFCSGEFQGDDEQSKGKEHSRVFGL